MLLQKVGRDGFKHGANSLSTNLFSRDRGKQADDLNRKINLMTFNITEVRNRIEQRVPT